VLSGKAIDNLSKAHFKEIIVTDSIPMNTTALPNLKVLTIAPLLAEVIRHMESGESVTQIYEK
jgi:ribose-phosphate pyrophosphokinase